ncbi:hypothetical protein NECID01_0085 [Nematocida sp. AWRm77]|nr:hypothetical protein NECID01_0085 [Nematocida sp. AWRm77]
MPSICPRLIMQCRLQEYCRITAMNRQLAIWPSSLNRCINSNSRCINLSNSSNSLNRFIHSNSLSNRLSSSNSLSNRCINLNRFIHSLSNRFIHSSRPSRQCMDMSQNQKQAMHTLCGVTA